MDWVEPTYEFLVLFFRNLILGEENELKNRYMHIRWNDQKPQIESPNIPKHQNEVSRINKHHLSVKEKAVVEIMVNNPNVSIDEIAAATDISDSTIDRLIKSLKEKGIIERKGRKNNPQWMVKI